MKNKTAYARYAQKRATRSPLPTDCLHAFLVGGAICALAQGCTMLLESLSLDQTDARLITMLILIFLTALLTGIGVFDKAARFAGAGTLVPITGFANAMSSEAVDCRSEGFVIGIGAKIFTVAGPVILYGTVSSVLYGLIYWLVSLF